MPSRELVVRKLSRAVAGTVGSVLIIWIALRGLRFSLLFAICAIGFAALWLAYSFAGFTALRRKE